MKVKIPTHPIYLELYYFGLSATKDLYSKNDHEVLQPETVILFKIGLIITKFKQLMNAHGEKMTWWLTWSWKFLITLERSEIMVF